MGRCISDGRAFAAAQLSDHETDFATATAEVRAAFSAYRCGWSWLRRALHTLAIAAIVLVLSFFLLPWAAQAGLAEGKAALERGDHEAAYAELAPAAENGNVEAQVLTATMLSEGKGVGQDYVQAMAWFLCAEKGASPVTWSSRAAHARIQAESAISRAGFLRASELASVMCASAAALADQVMRASHDLHTYRYSAFDKAFFAPGDFVMQLVADVADAVGMQFLRSDIQMSYANNTNYAFIAILSGLLWVVWTMLVLFILDRWVVFVANFQDYRQAIGDLAIRAWKSFD
jgi:hypothetical protein